MLMFYLGIKRFLHYQLLDVMMVLLKFGIKDFQKLLLVMLNGIQNQLLQYNFNQMKKVLQLLVLMIVDYQYGISLLNQILKEIKNIRIKLCFYIKAKKKLKKLSKFYLYLNLIFQRYHPYYYEMILSTASDGFNIFKPSLNEYYGSDDDE